MSLKAFHIAFIIVSILFTGLFGLWALFDSVARRDVGLGALGIMSLVIGALLVRYSGWFLKKLKNVGYL